MAPQITGWRDLIVVTEELEPETDEFHYTWFVAADDDDDIVYFGQLSVPKLEISFQQLSSALTPIPDEDIFPEWPSSGDLSQASKVLSANIYIKRPNLDIYDIFKKHNILNLIPQGLIEEAQTMQFLAQHPHPNIIRYHGCQVRRGYITGLVLDRYPHDLKSYLKHNVGTIDKEPFIQALESAIHHLHSLGWAHNDLNPGNILVNENSMPVLIDFGSSRKVGEKLGTSRGTKGWMDEHMKDYHTSEERHDISALEKIRWWLEKPKFGEAISWRTLA